MPVLQPLAPGVPTQELSTGRRRAQVVALSSDTGRAVEGLIDKHDLTFPVGYGADARHLAQLTGASVNDDPLYVQSTAFVLDPDGRVIVSVYSSGAIGRLVPADVIGLIRYHRANGAQDAEWVTWRETSSTFERAVGTARYPHTVIFHRTDRQGGAG